MEKSMKDLRKALKGKLVDSFDQGSVIRWMGGRFTYAAVKCGTTWFLTGGGRFYGEDRVSFEELVEILRRSDVTDVLVAYGWMSPYGN